MLPSSAVGTVEFRSLVEPVKASNPLVSYVEAEVVDINTQRHVVECLPVCYDDPIQANGSDECAMPGMSSYSDGEAFELEYDVVVVAVGEQPATFGVKGVEENCVFLKEISDAARLRRRVAQCYEFASLPTTRESEIDDVLNFVVVGGGATGVEFAGTLGDYVRSDIAARYPKVADRAKVTLLQSGDSILTQFSAGLQSEAMSTLEGAGIVIRLGVRVSEIKPGAAVLSSGDGNGVHDAGTVVLESPAPLRTVSSH